MNVREAWTGAERRTRTRIIAAAAVAGVLALSVILHATKSNTATQAEPSTDSALVTPPPSLPPNGLTGYGATVAEWSRTHRADPDPRLIDGCCYGPQIKYFGQSTLQDTWFGVIDDNGLIYSYQRAFSPSTSETAAVNALTSDDLPPDATLERSQEGDGCLELLYRSSTLGAAAPTLGPYVLIALVSPPDESIYLRDNIWSASVSPGDSGDLPPC